MPLLSMGGLKNVILCMCGIICHILYVGVSEMPFLGMWGLKNAIFLM